jgi:hypothetical protein
MAAAKQKKVRAKTKKNGIGKIDLEKFREGLSESGKVLFDIAMSVPEEELMSLDEVRAEIARRRGGIVVLNKR